MSNGGIPSAKELLRELREQGWRVEHTTQGHYKGFAPNGKTIVTFSVTDEPIVSSDIVGSTFGSIADLSLTRVVAGDLVKVLAWYDNEMGYAHALVEHVVKSGEYAR